MDRKFTVKDAVRIIGASKATLRNYGRDYSSYLSSGANPAFGVTRSYTFEDMRVFSYVRKMTGNGHSKQAVQDSLPIGLNDFEWDLPASEKTLEDVEGQIIPNSMLAKWEADMRERDEKIDELETENKELNRRVGQLEGENKVLRENRKGFWARVFGGGD